MPQHVQAVIAGGLSSDLVHQHGGNAMLPPWRSAGLSALPSDLNDRVEGRRWEAIGPTERTQAEDAPYFRSFNPSRVIATMVPPPLGSDGTVIKILWQRQ